MLINKIARSLTLTNYIRSLDSQQIKQNQFEDLIVDPNVTKIKLKKLYRQGVLIEPKHLSSAIESANAISIDFLLKYGFKPLFISPNILLNVLGKNNFDLLNKLINLSHFTPNNKFDNYSLLNECVFILDIEPNIIDLLIRFDVPNTLENDTNISELLLSAIKNNHITLVKKMLTNPKIQIGINYFNTISDKSIVNTYEMHCLLNQIALAKLFTDVFGCKGILEYDKI